MAKCVYCGNATILQINDRPVCTECSDLLDAGKKPPMQNVPKCNNDQNQ